VACVKFRDREQRASQALFTIYTKDRDKRAFTILQAGIWLLISDAICL